MRFAIGYELSEHRYLVHVHVVVLNFSDHFTIIMAMPIHVHVVVLNFSDHFTIIMAMPIQVES